MGIRRQALDEVLLLRGADPARMAEAREQAEKSGVALAEGIDRVQAVDDRVLVEGLAQITGLPYLQSVDIEAVEIALVRMLTLSIAKSQSVLPLWSRDGRVEVGISSLSALPALDDLRVLFEQPVQPVLLPPAILREAINKAFDKAAKSAEEVLGELSGGNDNFGDDDASLDLDGTELTGGDPNQAPIIKYVNAVILNAIKQEASDIHIEPFEKELSIRYRIDGVMYEQTKPPYKVQASIISRIKIMAGLNIAEKRIPQDGRIRTRMAGRDVDIRLSTLPVRHGERVVMRILERGSVISLAKIGMSEKVLHDFRKLIHLPHGIVLVCGPTGSGKTTTLYSALAEINTPDKNILTIEDPIEYELRGVGQTQVNAKIDLTFSRVIRAHLRQDPDIILVGETRDRETAENAIQASLTGHMVFSTIHTNDSPTAFTRLIDMGIEPFLVASSLIAILAQRLVRRLCVECKEQYDPSPQELKDVGLDPESTHHVLWRAVGCPACKNKGYRGRSGIYELLVVDDDARRMVTGGSDAGQIKKYMATRGMLTLRDDGVRKALSGETSLDEVLRVTQDDVIELD